MSRTIPSGNCKAKDPLKCSYHGALARMDEAVKAGDVQGYITARDEAVKASGGSQGLFNREKRVVPGWVDVKPVQSVLKVAKNRFLNDDADYLLSRYGTKKDRKKGRAERTENRLNFLVTTASVPTPMEAYALWLKTWMLQGGEVRKADYEYGRKAAVVGNNNAFVGAGEKFDPKQDEIDYTDLGWNRWTPTKIGDNIPAGYGGGHLDLLLLPGVVPTKLVSATNDSRPGWEWGHSTVRTLERDDSSPLGLRASLLGQNRGGKPTLYNDVAEYLKGKTVVDLMSAFSHRDTGLELPS